MKKSFVKTTTGNALFDGGVTLVPDLLLDTKIQEKLELSDDEVLFIIKILKYQKEGPVTDELLFGQKASKSAQRRRSSLIEKGYLIVTPKKSYCPTTKRYRTEYLEYDLSPLFNILDCPSSVAQEKAAKTYQRKTSEEMLHDLKVCSGNEEVEEVDEGYSIAWNAKETFNELEPEIKDSLEIFFKEYQDFYGKKYVASVKDLTVSDSILKNAKHIMDYIKTSSSWDSNFNPRLVFFNKVSFRKKELEQFAFKRTGMILSVAEETKRNAVHTYLEFLKQHDMGYAEFANKYCPNEFLRARIKNNNLSTQDYLEIIELLKTIT